MANNFNDLNTTAWSVAYATAAATDVLGPCRIMGCIVTGAAGTVTLHDSAAADNAKFTVETSAELTTVSPTFGQNGVRFGTGLSLAETGAINTITVLYILE